MKHNLLKGFAVGILAWLIMRLPNIQSLGVTSKLLFDVIVVVTITLIIWKQEVLPSLVKTGSQWSYKNNKLVLGFICVLTIAMIPGILQIKLVRIFESSDLPPSNQLVLDYETYADWRGEENSFIVSVSKSNGVLNVETMNEILEIEKKIKAFEGVDPETVLSYASTRSVVETVFDNSDGTFEIGKDLSLIYEHVNYQEDEKQRMLESLVLGHPLIKGRLISADQKSAIIQVMFDPSADLNLLYNQIMELTGVYSATESSAIEIQRALVAFVKRVIGYTETNYGTAGFFLVDVACLISILFVATVVTCVAWLFMLIFFSRSFGVFEGRKFHQNKLSGVVFTLVPLTLSPMLIIMGFLGYAGITVDTITGVIPIVYIAIASSYGVHLAHYILTAKGNSNEEKILTGINSISKPLLMTSVTTSIGFITLVPFDIMSIAKFGFFSAFGVQVLIFGIALFVSPAWFKMWPILSDEKESVKTHNIETRGIIAITKKLIANPRVTGIAVIILVAFSVAKLDDLYIGSNPTRFLEADSIIPKTTDLLLEKFGTNGALFIALDSGKPDGVNEPEFLKKLQALSDYVESDELVSFVQDYSELQIYLHEEFADGKGIPQQAKQASELLFAFEMVGDKTSLVDFDREKAFLYVWGNYEKSAEVQLLYDNIRSYASQNDLNISIGSEYVLWLAQTSYLVRGKVISWMQALCLIVLLAFVMYGGCLHGLIIATPLLCVTFFILAIMAIFDISLDISSTVITSITIGVGADFSIHLYNVFLENFKEKGLAIEESLERAIGFSAPPIIHDAETNMIGFSAFLLSSLLPVQHAGIMLVVSMMLASLSALIIIPIMIKALKKYV